MKPSKSGTREKTIQRLDPVRHQGRFADLWQRCLRFGAANHASSVWDAWQRSYAEPHRKYHDQRHVFRCLEQLDLASGLVQAFESVELAIWFHDIVNEPGQPDNEARSAARFRELAQEALPRDLVQRVERLVLVTTHREPIMDQDEQVICDIDLASFGCQWACFLDDSADIQAEFRGSEMAYYRQKRLALAAVLRRPRIFATDFFHYLYEFQARDNIRKYLQVLDRRCAGSA